MTVKDASQIRDEDANKLRTIFRKKPDTPLHERLVFWYWEYFGAYSRLGRTAMSDEMLVVVAMRFAEEMASEDTSGPPSHVLPQDPQHFGHLIDAGKVEPQAAVVVSMGGRDREGTYLRAVRVDGKTREVVVQVGTEERRFTPQDVRVAVQGR